MDIFGILHDTIFLTLSTLLLYDFGQERRLLDVIIYFTKNLSQPPDSGGFYIYERFFMTEKLLPPIKIEQIESSGQSFVVQKDDRGEVVALYPAHYDDVPRFNPLISALYLNNHDQ